jgi:cyclopropane-fatty-acyl-phospholipid synthase
MKAIVAATGDRENLTGISLSRNQVPFVRSTLGCKCEHDDFISREYQPDSVDKVITVGSLEHVRPTEIEVLHQKLFRALRHGGRLVHQFFSLNRNDESKHTALIHYFFPGSMLSSHEHVLACIKQSGFRIELDTTDDYRPTLRAWFKNLVANKQAALRLVGVHTYNKYLVFLSGSWRFFNDGEACLHRLLLVKD